MKKQSKKQTTETAAPATVAPVQIETTATPPSPQPEQPKQEQQERKPDFYQRLVTERPTEAASILATLCRRKDKALRAMNDAHSAGKDFGDAYRIALSIAFPKNKPATATA
jgi:hypothetical protein